MNLLAYLDSPVCGRLGTLKDTMQEKNLIGHMLNLQVGTWNTVQNVLAFANGKEHFISEPLGKLSRLTVGKRD